MPSQIIEPNQAHIDSDESNSGAYVQYWQHLAATMGQVQMNPGLIESRFNQIETLIGLGLSTLSLNECARLESATDQHARLDGYKQQISVLASDRVSIEQREHTLRMNLARLEDQIVVEESQIDQWRSAASEISWYRALDGNIVRCNEQKGRVAHLLDAKTAHQRGMAPLIEQMKIKNLSPILLEGVDPHWILKSLLDAPPPKNIPNFRQRILVLQEDWNEFFDGLSCADLGDELGSPRLMWFVGSGAGERLLAWFDERCDDVPPVMIVQNPLLRTRVTPDSRELMKKIDAKSLKCFEFRVQAIQERKPKDRQELASRFACAIAALNDDCPQDKEVGEPLRVLIPTSRYTTYVQYAAQDIAETLTRCGCVCYVEMEQDDSQIYTKGKYLGTLIAFDPDLVITINHPRALRNEHAPADIPHVCWIQDAMDHLLDVKVGRSLGDLDFIVGMTKDELVEKYEYPKQQVQWMPMVAAGAKFSREVVNTEFDCEIAWVTHQSEHPDAFKERMVQNMREHSPNAVGSFVALLDEVHRMITTMPSARMFTEIHKLVDQSFFPTGTTPETVQSRSSLLNTQVIPYAERVFRHQVAAWASRIAVRRGWRMKLYGNGWENHPELSSHAAGALGHGDELVEGYQRAVVHLHASVNQVMHQRVSECLLSGGLPLCRALRDAFAVINNMAVVEAVDDKLGKEICNQAGVQTGLRIQVAQCSNAQRLIDELRRLGLCDSDEYQDPFITWPISKVQAAAKSLRDPIELGNAQMFASSTDLFFTSEAQLESLLERAIEDPQWRADRIKSGVSSMPKEMTMDGFVENILRLVHGRL